MTRHPFLYFIIISFLFGCAAKEEADFILINGNIYTLDEHLPSATAIAVKDGLITRVGSDDEIKELQGSSTEVLDAHGKFVMPGFIEGHGHFSNYGRLLSTLNLLETKTWDEITEMVKEKVETAEPGDWIEGRGWHQEKWSSSPGPTVNGYPFHDAISAISPDNPVILFHASGHALFANAKAMELAGVSKESADPKGGHILRDQNGEAIGVFEERAMAIIRDVFNDYLKSLPPEEEKEKWLEQIQFAQEGCLKNGVTSFQDAGSTFMEVDRYEALAESGQLKIRLWSMLRHPLDTLKGRMNGFPKIDVGKGYFTCRAIKSEVDGALGAFGAWLLKAYNDKPNFLGQNTTSISDVEGIAAIAKEKNMQLCVHAIGDRANREVLNIFEKYLEDPTQGIEKRWRIEHAQHLDTADIPRFRTFGIIASMQGIHCTSDAPFVVRRLGNERARYGAYPWRSLLDNGVLIANGTDVPVEKIDPIACYYASVTRTRADTGLEFFKEQAMTREEAIYSYTLANAYAAFEEDVKGSLEKGKVADIVILSENLLECSDEAILDTEVLYTIVGGKILYKK